MRLQNLLRQTGVCFMVELENMLLGKSFIAIGDDGLSEKKEEEEMKKLLMITLNQINFIVQIIPHLANYLTHRI